MVVLRNVRIAAAILLIGLVLLGCQQSRPVTRTAAPADPGHQAAANPPAPSSAPAPVPPFSTAPQQAAAASMPTTPTQMAQAPPPRGLEVAVPAIPVVPSGQTTRSDPFVVPASAVAVSAEDDLHRVHRIVMEQSAQLETYIARFRRREFFKGKDQPEEVMSFLFRRQPFSVRMKWLAPEATAGREAVYVKDRYKNELHVLVEKNMLMMGGKLMSFPLDSAMVKDKSRHSITDAGIQHFAERLDEVVKAQDRGDRRLGTLVYRGPQTRPEFARPAEMLEHLFPAGFDPLLPQGGRRFTYIDPDTQLPQLVITQDETGRQVEYYCYDRLQRNVRLDEHDFDPACLAGPAKN